MLQDSHSHPVDGSPSGPDNENVKRPFVEPRLRFVEPKLTRQGGLTETTCGFFGSFSL